MLTYTVHEPPDSPADRVDRAERLEFVRDGFHWSAFLFTPLWLLAHRLWVPFLLFVAVVAVLATLADTFKVGAQWPTLLGFASQALVGYEAGSLRRWRLDRRGWLMVGTVTGRNRTECERRFFTAWLDRQPVIALAPSEPSRRPRGGPAAAPWRALLGWKT